MSMNIKEMQDFIVDKGVPVEMLEEFKTAYMLHGAEVGLQEYKKTLASHNLVKDVKVYQNCVMIQFEDDSIETVDFKYSNISFEYFQMCIMAGMLKHSFGEYYSTVLDQFSHLYSIAESYTNEEDNVSNFCDEFMNDDESMRLFKHVKSMDDEVDMDAIIDNDF